MSNSPSTPFPHDERARVARALHDGVAQTLFALNLELAAAARDCVDGSVAEHLSTARALATDALEQARAVSYAVQPPPHGDPFRPLIGPDRP